MRDTHVTHHPRMLFLVKCFPILAIVTLRFHQVLGPVAPGRAQRLPLDSNMAPCGRPERPQILNAMQTRGGALHTPKTTKQK